MKHNYLKKSLLIGGLILGSTGAWSQITTFDYTGAVQTYVVPPGVTTLQVDAVGASGGTSDNDAGSCIIGGWGGSASGVLTVTPGETLYIYVGGEGFHGNVGGWNGGGDACANVSTCAKGGGASDIRQGGTDFADRVIVAGGGGGAEWSGCSGSAGDGGGLDGEGGAHPSPGGRNGGGGTQIAGGAAGIGGYSGFVGTFGEGGNSGSHPAGHSGSGGGGWYGGGGSAEDGHAGGGSSYIAGLTDAVTTAGVNEGDGQITIEVLCIGLEDDIPASGVCDGESVTLSASSVTGGVVTWDGGVTDGVAFFPPPGTTTTYTATSTSGADCLFIIDIHSSPVPDITAFSSSPSACEGALITLWGEGGLAEGPDDEVYTWTGTGDIDPTDSVAFPAEDGTVTYTLVGSYLGCDGPEVEIILDAESQPDVTGVATPDQVCLGDAYTLHGESDFATSYDWGGGTPDGGSVTPPAPGTYIHFVVGVSDAGCTDTALVTVNVHANPIVDGGDDITVCEGDEVTLSASGASDYDWTPAIVDGEAFTPDAGVTTYTVVGTDGNGCSDDNDVVVTVVELPYVSSAIVMDEYYGFDGSINITVAGGSGDYTYSWSHGPTTEDVDGLTSGVIYTVTIDDITIDPGMCSTTESYNLARFIGIDGETVSQLSAYPNPTTDQITVTYEGQFNYEVSTLLGQVVASGTAIDQEQLSLNTFANGTYIVKVIAGNEISFVQIVKQ